MQRLLRRLVQLLEEPRSPGIRMSQLRTGPFRPRASQSRVTITAPISTVATMAIASIRRLRSPLAASSTSAVTSAMPYARWNPSRPITTAETLAPSGTPRRLSAFTTRRVPLSPAEGTTWSMNSLASPSGMSCQIEVRIFWRARTRCQAPAAQA